MHEKLLFTLNFQIVTESPSWLIIICLLAGFLYAWTLYRKDRFFTDAPTWLIRLMAVFRFAVVAILSILLLSPLIKTVFREVEKPVVVIVQDNTESVIRIRDSVNFKNSYPEKINSLGKLLEEDFDTRYFSFGNEVSDQLEVNFNGKESDMSSVVEDIQARFGGRNLGAVILATDGLYNKGSNPLYSYSSLKVPVYTIGLGDTSVLKDILVSKVKHNKLVFTGNVFPVEITVDARKCGGESTTLEILRNNSVVYSREVQIASNRYNSVIPVFLEADKKGMIHYTVRLKGLDDEINYENNQRDFFIEVTENRMKILLLAHASHPDISAIRTITERIPNYEIKIETIDDFNGDLSNYNLVVLHNLPSGKYPISTISDELKKREIPVLYILGNSTLVSGFNKLKTGVTITGNNNTTGEVLPDPELLFSLFTIEEEYINRIAGFPPLSTPFGNYEQISDLNTLLEQKIGSVSTGMPQMWFHSDGSIKVGVIGGEGIWKWRLQEFLEFENDDAVSAIVLKSIQYLASKEENSPLKLIFKNAYMENEPVIFDAEVRNQAGELINTPDVNITFTNEEDARFQYSFSKSEFAYILNAGYLPVGVYSFTAEVKIGESKYSKSGTFVINSLQAERTETIADHRLLQTIADKTGGEHFSTGDMKDLAKKIKSRNDIKPVAYSQKKLSEVINLKWIFILIMTLLSLEWFLRKRNGGY